MPTIVSTPGASNANSFQDLAEALAYFEGRLPVPEWEDADSQEGLLIMATRVLCMMLTPFRRFVPAQGGRDAYYITRPAWTGTVASTTQALCWPRIGMYDRNGNPIPSNVIPKELKEAHAELAGQLAKTDRTQDDDVRTQGISAVSAGSVSVNFQNRPDPGDATTKVLPDAVLFLLVPSWLSQEVIEYVGGFDFEVL